MEQLLPWERLLKKILWAQLGDIRGRVILDFGSGLGVTASQYAKYNQVTAIEPCAESVSQRYVENAYSQIVGGLDELESDSFDVIFCHNVLEYTLEREQIIKEFYRLLKQGGMLSIVKHNRCGRIVMEAVLHNSFENVNALLDGNETITSKFGTIHYYDDTDIVK